MTERVELLVQRLANTGEGVAPHGGRAVFVPGALPGERVLADVSQSGKVQSAVLVQVLSRSQSRRTPACSLAGRCGGCDWMHLEDEAQLSHKEELVLASLEHVGRIDRSSFALLPAVKSLQTLGYRRRAVLRPVAGALGFFGRASHLGVEVARCPALTSPLTDFPSKLTKSLGPKGLRELEEVRLLECEGRIAVSLHFKAHVRPRHREAMHLALRDGLIDGAVLQPGEGSGQAELLGRPVLEEDGLFYRPDVFAQTNAQVNRQLVRQTLELLDLRPTDRVLELYSGNGNFTLQIAASAAQVLAVESSAASVALAQRAATAHKVENVRFVQGDSEKIAPGLIREAGRFERLLVDPPRSGAAGVGEWASGLLVERVVYVACDPTSLARDAQGLLACGYAPIALQVFDLFPQTHHVEAAMAFGRS